MNKLTFEQLRKAHAARIPLYHNKKGELLHNADGSNWSPSQWFQALIGELGEYANFRKKYERGDLSKEEFIVEATKELADSQSYLDMLAMQLGIDLGEATQNKFNEVSKRIGVDVFITTKEEIMRQFLGNEKEVLDLIDDVILEFVNSDIEFTAYDVTVETRKRTNIEFFHRDVATHIHSSVRSLAPSYGVKQHSAYNARQYYNTAPNNIISMSVKNQTQPLPVTFKAALVTANIPPSTLTGNAVATTAKPRSEGRVLVPATVVRFVGAKPGDYLYVTKTSNGELTLAPGSLATFYGATGYMVDKHSNIRLTKRTLKKSSLENKDVVIMAHSDRIVITEK